MSEHLDEWDENDDRVVPIERGRKRRELAAGPVVASDEREEFWVASSALSDAATRAMHVLARRAERVYRRGDTLSIVTQGDDPGVRDMTTQRLDHELGALVIAKTKTPKGDEKSIALPPAMLAQMVSGTCRGIDALRRLDGIVSTPFLAPDGSVVESVGYHAGSRHLMLDNAIAVDVKQCPTQENAAEALARLVDVFIDFPYPDAADRHVPIAALLTLLASPAIEGNIPAFLFDATTAGSGKTLQQDVIGLLATGEICRKTSWIRDEDERRKSLMASALAGGNVLAFDNVDRGVAFGGADIDMLLTAGGRLQFRGLGAKDLLRVDWRPTILASGNNIGLTGDTHRRVLRARLQTNEEDPEKRTEYVHPERANRLIEWARKNRATLVSDGLTVLRSFVVAGRPNPLRMGSFAEWAGLVPSAIVYAGGPNVLACVPGSDDVSSETDADLRLFLETWPQIRMAMGPSWFAKDLVAHIWRTEGANEELTELRDTLAESTRAKQGYDPSVKSIAKLLARWRGRVMGGRRVYCEKDLETNTLRWCVEEVKK